MPWQDHGKAGLLCNDRSILKGVMINTGMQGIACILCQKNIILVPEGITGETESLVPEAPRKIPTSFGTGPEHSTNTGEMGQHRAGSWVWSPYCLEDSLKTDWDPLNSSGPYSPKWQKRDYALSLTIRVLVKKTLEYTHFELLLVTININRKYFHVTINFYFKITYDAPAHISLKKHHFIFQTLKVTGSICPALYLLSTQENRAS